MGATPGSEERLPVPGFQRQGRNAIIDIEPDSGNERKQAREDNKESWIHRLWVGRSGCRAGA
jgi:hypothetical protein